MTEKYDPEARSERGRAMCEALTFVPADWDYHEKSRVKLTSSERATFDEAFVRARAVAGVRPAVDLALAAMRRELGRRLGTPTWRAG